MSFHSPGLLPISIGQSPCPQRQTLEFQDRRLDKHDKGDCSNQHTQDVGDVVAIAAGFAYSTAVEAAVLVGLQGARERRRDQIALQLLRWRRNGWGNAGGHGEKVDEFEDEVPRECTTEIGDARPVSIRQCR